MENGTEHTQIRAAVVNDMLDKICNGQTYMNFDLIAQAISPNTPIWTTADQSFVYIVDNKVYTHAGYASASPQPDSWFDGKFQSLHVKNRSGCREDTHVIFFDSNNTVLKIIGDGYDNVSAAHDGGGYILLRCTKNGHMIENLLDSSLDFVSEQWYDYINIIHRRFAVVRRGIKHNILSLRSGELVSDEWCSGIVDCRILHGFIIICNHRGLRTLMNLTDGSLVNGWYSEMFVKYDDDPYKTIVMYTKKCPQGRNWARMTLPEFLEFAENN